MYRLPRLVLLLALLGSVIVPASEAQLIAERITDANFATHHVGGPDADAGVGDWFLSNGTICAVISDPEHESPLAPKGGVLLDLGHCGEANDQWAVLQPMLNLSQSHVVPVTGLDAGTTAGEAWIRTRALFAGVEITTTYSLSLSEPDALRVQSGAERVRAGDALFSLGTILLHTSGQTRPFSLLRGNAQNSLGFEYPASDRHSLFSLVGALVATDVSILVGSDGMPAVSYGVEQLGASVTYEQQQTQSLRTFSVTGLHFTAFNTLSEPAWVGTGVDAPSLIDLARIPFIDLVPKAKIQKELRIWVGRRSDVASITDRLWSKEPLIVGSIDEADARIHILNADGAPVTVSRPDASGRFQLRLPAGTYRAEARAPGGRDHEMNFVVSASPAEQVLAPIRLSDSAWVRLPDDFIGRLVFLDETAGKPMRFGDDLLGFRIGDEPIPSAHEALFLNLAGVAEDPDRIPLPAGRYRVLAVRGPEYDLAELSIELVAGEVKELVLAPLARVQTSPGWIAADFHVHSGESFDSGLQPTRQIAAFAASGAEVLVATEHDRIVDPQRSLDATGLSSELTIVNGVEITSAFEGGDSPYSTGHWNAFPVTYRPRAYRGGAPTLEGRRARDAIADIRSLESKPFLQLNHPRPGLDEEEGDTFFAHMGVAGVPFEPAQPLTRTPNSELAATGTTHAYRDIDYDGVELLNGPELIRYRRTRADWFSLMLQGETRVATSNSDSHRLGVIVGLPRTYVQLADDSVAGFDEARFMQAISNGRAFGSTGPLLDVRLDETGIGGLHTQSTGLLEIRVDSAPWVPVSEWRVYVNAELVHRAPIGRGETAKLPLAFERDAFVTVEVEGPARGVYTEVLPEFTPFAFTNPIFVDIDGNGRYDAPGLPTVKPATLTTPDEED